MLSNGPNTTIAEVPFPGYMANNPFRPAVQQGAISGRTVPARHEFLDESPRVRGVGSSTSSNARRESRPTPSSYTPS